MRAKVLLTDPEPVRYLNMDVSPQLDAVVVQLLSKKRWDRPDGAAELADRLAALPELASNPGVPNAGEGPTARANAARPVDSNRSPTFLLFGESPEGLDLSAIRGQDGRWECIDGRWWTAVLSAPGTPQEAAADVAHRALKLRAQLPRARMALMVDQSASRLDELIDRAVTTIATDSLASIFRESAGGTESGIRLDEAMAALLEQQFQVTRGSDGLYLHPPVAGPPSSE